MDSLRYYFEINNVYVRDKIALVSFAPALHYGLGDSRFTAPTTSLPFSPAHTNAIETTLWDDAPGDAADIRWAPGRFQFRVSFAQGEEKRWE